MEKTTWNGGAARIRRVFLGLNLKGVAKSVGVSKSLLSTWERDEATPTPEEIQRLARVLKCKPADLAREARVA